MARHGAFLAAAIALVEVLPLTGCNGEKDRPACQRTEPAAAGPGDALGLFPTAVGDLWAYRVEEAAGSYRSRVEVVGPASVGGRRGVRLTDTPMGALAAVGGATTVAVEPGGVTVLESGEFEDLAPGLGALVGPHLALRFPAAAGDTFTSYDCTGLPIASLDGDARADAIDVRAVVTVVGEEEVATPAGPRVGLRVDTRLDLTVHSSVAGAVAFTSRERDWYVPGLGLARSSATFSAPGELDQTTTRALYAWSVGSQGHGPVTRPQALPVGTISAGEVAPEGWQVYRVSAPTGAPLVFGLLAQDGPLGLGGVSQGGAVSWDCRSSPRTTAAQCLIAAGAGEVEVEVDGGGLTGASAGFAVLAGAQPAVPSPSDEVAAFARGEVAAGQVGTRGRSVYTITGLTPGVPVTVALLGATGAADLRAAPGAPPDTLSTCWLDFSTVTPTAEQCSLTPLAGTATFAVEAGPLERVGAAYLLAAW